jgi:NTP pyrophosphatase (non-canonical NTP hydrolase)
LRNQSLEKLGILSVDDYVDIVKNVWGEIHPRRTVFDHVLHVLDHASKLGEAIRRENADLILKEMAETANWLFGFVGKLNDRKTGWESRLNIQTKFSRMIWNKYPRLCPHCFQRVYISSGGKKAAQSIAGDLKERCKYCLADYPKVEERSTAQMRQGKRKNNQLKQSSKKELRNYAQEMRDKIPKTLREMEAMFHSIYESNTALATLESIGFHLLEEAGEMGRAVIDIYTDRISDVPLKEKVHSLCDEVAEVFSWLCSLTLKVRGQAKTFDKYEDRLVSYVLPSTRAREKLADYVGLEQILWVTYRNEKTKQYQCPYCGSSECGCKLEFAWENTQANA